MAERSFATEVGKLRAGAGEEFFGEGILAVTKALLQSGVSYVGGYQGAPISHLMDVLGDAKEVLDELGVHFENSASEATAAASLAASVYYPLRGAITFKSTVGTNVASDALANLASGGVTGGALIIVGEDYGEGSSIMQERSHAFAMKSQFWLLDPRPNLTAIVDSVDIGFRLSEASNSPVMLQLRLRSCHLHGRFIAKDNVKPEFTLRDAMENPLRDTNRIVLPPASFMHEQEKVTKRWPAAVKFMGGGAGGGGGEGGSPTKLRPGEVYNAKLDRVEAKPGSELYNKQSKSHASDYKAASGTQSKMDESIAKIDNILDVKNKTAFEGNFGGYNAYGTRMLPGENSDLRKSIDSFKSDLKMAGLELIRQGGSIGQMTEREWPIVEQMIASIDPVLGEENARKVFEDIKTRFQTIKAAAQDVYDTQWSSTQYHKGLRGGAKGGDGKSSDVRSAADAILKGE